VSILFFLSEPTELSARNSARLLATPLSDLSETKQSTLRNYEQLSIRERSGEGEKATKRDLQLLAPRTAACSLRDYNRGLIRSTRRRSQRVEKMRHGASLKARKSHFLTLLKVRRTRDANRTGQGASALIRVSRVTTAAARRAARDRDLMARTHYAARAFGRVVIRAASRANGARQFPIHGDVPSISAELSGPRGHGAFLSRRDVRCVPLCVSDFYRISKNIGTIDRALICPRLLLRDDKVSYRVSSFHGIVIGARASPSAA